MLCVLVALTYGVRNGDEDTDSLEVVLDSALSPHSKMPHVEVVKAAHTDEDDKAELPGLWFLLVLDFCAM